MMDSVPPNSYGMAAGKAVTAKQARLKKEEAEKCTEENAAACYDHTGNVGIGPVKVSKMSIGAVYGVRREDEEALRMVKASCHDSTPPGSKS